jgi:protein-L-isoaspartate(D-aspartate) O-methyltransferase
LREAGIANENVLSALAAVPRHVFIDDALASRAYDNDALPIGHGQTISQPYIVARMLELALEAPQISSPPHRWLEIGTGCGYQAAVMAQLARQVLSVERYRVLHDRAVQALDSLKIRNVWQWHGDGLLGLADHAPFDAIVVAAGGLQVPPALAEQLAIGGRLVIPVGPQHQQELLVIKRSGKDTFERRSVAAVRFVPLLSGVVDHA